MNSRAYLSKVLSVTWFVSLFLTTGALAASVSVTPSSGPGNMLVTLSASGFNDGYNTGFYFDTNYFAGRCPAEAYGNCSIQVRMLTGEGPHSVMALNATGQVATTTFTVLPASLSVNRSCGPGGMRLTLTGNNFAAAANIGVYFNGSFISGSGMMTDESGSFSQTIAVPVLPEGDYVVNAQGGGSLASASFSIANCVGTILDVIGNPTLTSPGGAPRPARPGDRVRAGDILKTGAGDRARLGLDDNTEFTLSQKSKLPIDEFIYDPDTNEGQARYSPAVGFYRFLSGVMVKKPDPNIIVHTDFGNIGIRGTEFVSRRDPCSTTQEVYLIHGQLAIKPTYATVTNIIDAPATIFFDATNVWTSGLTQSAYDAMKDLVNQTNLVTYASWAEQYFGCTNDNAAASATADPDTDGQNNYAEFLAHTDPTTNASVFKLLSAAREGDGVRVSWQTHGDVTNVVQAAASLGGNYTNLSAAIPISGVADVTTNYLDVGALTNSASRFYRIQLGP